MQVGVGLTMTMIVLQYFWTKYCSNCLIEATKSMDVKMKEGTDPYLKLMRDVLACPRDSRAEFRLSWRSLPRYRVYHRIVWRWIVVPDLVRILHG